jgi:hypothetical protein
MEDASRAMTSADTAHALATYTRIRRGMALLALALPLALLLGGLWLYTTPAQPSMSAYYHAHPNLRDTLVGVLVAMGFFLMFYKGRTGLEDGLLDLAGFCALGIAYCEMTEGSDCAPSRGASLHGAFAVTFFVAIAVVAVLGERSARSCATFQELPHRQLWYRVSLAMMLGSMAVQLVARFALPAELGRALCESNLTFWVEAVAVWGFAIYWLLQTLELDRSISWNPFRRREAPPTP